MKYNYSQLQLHVNSPALALSVIISTSGMLVGKTMR